MATDYGAARSALANAVRHGAPDEVVDHARYDFRTARGERQIREAAALAGLTETQATKVVDAFLESR